MNEEKLYSSDAEMSVLGALLIDNSKINKVSEIVKYSDFFAVSHQIIFKAMQGVHERGEDLDLLTLSDSLKKNKLLERIGGSAYLVELTNYVHSSSHVLTYAKIVSDYSGKRQIQQAAKEIAESSENGSLDEALEKVKQKVDEVNRLNVGNNKFQITSMADHIEDARIRFENWGKMYGLSTGFPAIDTLTNGLVGGELIIVAGETSRGKTLLSMNIANNIAQSGGRVLFVTLEMTHAELTSRYMFLNGGFDTASFKVSAENTVFQHNDELDWKDVDGLISNAKEKLDVDFVVIDHLHYFTRELQNVSEDLGRITKEFKKAAIRYNIPIVLISHVRKLAQGEDLNENALRGSSLIGQDADIVLFVARDPETNEMGVMITKNRNRGKLSDRTKDWAGRNEKDINTIYLQFNNTKLRDPTDVPPLIKDIMPGATQIDLV